MEPEFDFTGQIIFISNLNSDKIDDAVKSRTIVVDLQLSRREICEYLKTLIKVIEPKMEMGSKKEVLGYITENCETFDNFNIRSFIKACRIRRVADMKKTDWRKMIMAID